MKERPILFSAPMIRAILAGKKSQTRRVVKPQPSGYVENVYRPFPHEPNNWQGFGGDYIHWYGRCPYGQPGDQLWVRETWGYATLGFNWARSIEGGVVYKAGGENIPQAVIDAFNADRHPNVHVKPEDFKAALGWKPSIHMPRIASRIQLEITGIRVERLQDISEVDALAEGIQAYSDGTYRDYNVPDDKIFESHTYFFASPVDSYRTLWDTINGPGSWEANPWVWVIEFRRIKP